MWTQPEVEWDEDEQAWMLALAEYEAHQCDGCGGQLDETADEDVWWTVPPPVRCFRCTELAKAQEKYLQVNKDTGNYLTRHPRALKFQAIREN